MIIVALPNRQANNELRETPSEFMRQRPSVLFVPVYKRTNKKGLCPVYCRITYAGHRAEFSTSVTIYKGDIENGKLKKGIEGFEHKNNTLLFIENELQNIYIQLRLNKESISAKKIRNIYLRPPEQIPTLYELTRAYVRDKISSNISSNTQRTYSARLNTIKEFLTESNLLHAPVCEIRPEIAAQLETYMLDRNLKFVYINRHTQLLESVIKKAVGKGYLTHNILSGHERRYDQPKAIVSLSKKELANLEGYSFVSPTLQKVAHFYVFCCYTSFAYADLLSFDYEKDVQTIEGKKWIVKHRQKSKVEQITPLFTRAEEILKRYNYNLPVMSLCKYNVYIKEIAAILGIEKHLTTHTARKTFAMLRIEEGYSLESIAKMMGHTSTQQTQNVYAKVTHTRIALEMKNRKAA